MAGSRAVGWIGAGKMGLPMSGHLIAAGHGGGAVCEPDPANRAAAVAQGAAVAERPPHLADRFEVIFAIIPDDATLRAVVFGKKSLTSHLRQGQIVVEMSRLSPAVSAELAAALAGRGAGYLWASVPAAP